MARGRMLNKSLAKSIKFEQLSGDFPRLVYCMMMPFADRDGRLDGDPSVIKSDSFPRRRDVTVGQVADAIMELSSVGLIDWYEVDGQPTIQICRFKEEQVGLNYGKEAASVFPEKREGSEPVQPSSEQPREDSGPTPENSGNPPEEPRETRKKLGPKEKGKGKENSPTEGAVAPSEQSLFKSIQEAFLSKNGGHFSDYGKEGTAIKGLIAKAEKRFPDAPEEFLSQFMGKFWELRQRDQFFGKQPFTPSALNSSGIFDRVMVEFENRESLLDPEVVDYYRGKSA